MSITFIDNIKHFIEGLLGSSTKHLEYELIELENIFSLLICSSFLGISQQPLYISLNLLPYIERELHIMFSKHALLDDELASWFGKLDIG